jgi:phage tail sheath protein FI
MATIDYRITSSARVQAPGVYLEEIAPQGPPLFRTGVPAFVGFVQADGERSDEEGRPCALTGWEQFRGRVGRSVRGGFLEYAVRGFFENGGDYCIVLPLRVPAGEPDSFLLTEELEKLFTKDRSGWMEILEQTEDADLICVPDVMIEGLREDQEVVLRIQRHVLEYCSDMGDRFAILDVAPIGATGGNSFTQVSMRDIEHAIEHWQDLSPSEGALYYPWIRVQPFPDEHRDVVLVPPCGHIAGIYARSDSVIGVHKAPANEIVEGAMDLEVHLTDEGQGELNDVGVNCLRSFPRRGIRVWGARTLSRLPNWKYVNVRRLFLTLVRWIERNMNDLVFESNGPPLWERVGDRLGGYCYELFVRGALRGDQPNEAFFVKCDAEINPPEVREAGQLICEVGLAPLTPAEFIIVRITRNAAGAAVTMSTVT